MDRMVRVSIAWAMALVACGPDQAMPDGTVSADDGPNHDTTSATSSAMTTPDPSTSSATLSTSNGPASTTESTTDATTGSSGDTPSDVPTTECTGLPAGIVCIDGVATECDGDGNVVDTQNCSATECIEAVGCVTCLEGQIDCAGPHVVQCNVEEDPATWEIIETCDPAAGQACMIPTGSCQVLEPIGTTDSTGTFHRFAEFTVGAGVFLGGYDVDSYGDRIYVTGFNGTIDVYEVELLDSDGDGMLEPNQHPDDPANTGPIEERTLTFVEAINYPGTISQSVEELYILDDRLFKGGQQINEYIFASEALSTAVELPDWIFNLSQIAFEDVNGAWYGSSENDFHVMQHDGATDEWGLAFAFPAFGPHTDGLEVITHPDTSVPHVYVTAMSSTMIMQFRKDAEDGWVQENVFTNSAMDVPVEGMGFGALYHFWGTPGQSVIEFGGGDITPYVDGSPSP